jgi:hypothetical protein
MDGSWRPRAGLLQDGGGDQDHPQPPRQPLAGSDRHLHAPGSPVGDPQVGTASSARRPANPLVPTGCCAAWLLCCGAGCFALVAHQERRLPERASYTCRRSAWYARHRHKVITAHRVWLLAETLVRFWPKAGGPTSSPAYTSIAHLVHQQSPVRVLLMVSLLDAMLRCGGGRCRGCRECCPTTRWAFPGGGLSSCKWRPARGGRRRVATSRAAQALLRACDLSPPRPAASSASTTAASTCCPSACTW